jgi:AraC family transcriptional activator FtrA
MTNVTILLPPAGLPHQFAAYREIFGAEGGPCFTLTVARPGERAGAGGLDLLAGADIVAVASGGHDAGAAVGTALRAAVRRGCRILAVGRAVRTVAATGLLDGRPAAACPAGAEALRDLFPLVRVAVGVRFVDDDPIFTAAQDPAMADLCLHLGRKDHGVAAAAAIARSLHGLTDSSPPFRRRLRPLPRLDRVINRNIPMSH